MKLHWTVIGHFSRLRTTHQVQSFGYRAIEKSIDRYLSNVSSQAVVLVEWPPTRWSTTSDSRPVNAISSHRTPFSVALTGRLRRPYNSRR